MPASANVAIGGEPSHAPAGWTFEVDQCVTHATQVMPSLITSAVRTSNGLEVYTTESYLAADTVPGRVTRLGTAAGHLGQCGLQGMPALENAGLPDSGGGLKFP